MAFAPLIVALAGAAYQGIQKSQADQFNAAVAKNEQSAAVNQATAQEALVRRNSREMLGRQAAAFGAAGVGYGGSSEGALDQSAVNQELDALNTRYHGAMTGYGYGVQAQIEQSQAKQDTAAALLSGASALTKTGGYSFAPKSPGEQSGVTSPQPSSGLGK